jgi:hypothetical protein
MDSVCFVDAPGDRPQSLPRKSGPPCDIQYNFSSTVYFKTNLRTVVSINCVHSIESCMSLGAGLNVLAVLLLEI